MLLGRLYANEEDLFYKFDKVDNALTKQHPNLLFLDL